MENLSGLRGTPGLQGLQGLTGLQGPRGDKGMCIGLLSILNVGTNLTCKTPRFFLPR